MGADAAMAARLRLAARLRSLRAGRDLPAQRAAGALGSSPAKVSRIESGRVPAQPGDVEALLDLYGVSDPVEQQALLDLAGQAGRAGWWDSFPEPLPASLKHALSLEAAADVIEIVDSQAVPALLQTPDYARAVAAAGLRGTWRAGMNPWVLARRRQLMQEASGPQLWAVIGSAAVRRPPGGNVAVLRRQIEHLMSAANVAIQLIPESEPAELAGAGPFTYLRFMHMDLSDVVLFEQLTDTAIVDRSSDVAQYWELFTLMVVSALTADESRQALGEILRELELTGPPLGPRGACDRPGRSASTADTGVPAAWWHARPPQFTGAGAVYRSKRVMSSSRLIRPGCTVYRPTAVLTSGQQEAFALQIVVSHRTVREDGCAGAGLRPSDRWSQAEPP